MDTLTIIIITIVFLAILIIALGFSIHRRLDLLLKTLQQKPLSSPENCKQLAPLKIQAYERLILYVERMELEGLVMRTFLPEMTAQQLQTVLTRTIREEFEHNITQQLYVTETAWKLVQEVRELILMLIGQAYNTVKPDTNGLELAKLLFAYTQNPEIYLFTEYPAGIKREMKKELS